MQKLKIAPLLQIDKKTLEEIKKLRTNISFLDSSIKVLNITSAVGKEGKSMISFWLANTIAATGKKVVLVDGNLRNKEKQSVYVVNKDYNQAEEKRRISHNKKTKNSQDNKNDQDIYLYGKTLNLYLNGKTNKEDIILDTEINNLSIILSGTVPDNPSELLSNNLLKELMLYLRLNYDYVIIDTPAVGEVTDGLILDKYSDGCILVVEPGIVSYKLAQKVKAQIENSGVKMLGVVLNKA